MRWVEERVKINITFFPNFSTLLDILNGFSIFIHIRRLVELLFIHECMLINIDLNALFIIIWGTNYSKVIYLEWIVVLEAESIYVGKSEDTVLL